MAKETCPRCGSEDLKSWGSERRMCNNCGEIFSVEVREDREEEVADIEVTEKEDLEEFTYKPGAYLEQLKKERAQAEKEAREVQAMFSEMSDDLEDAGDEATHETEIVDIEPEADTDEEIEVEEEPEEESASAEYERLHAKHQKKMERDRKREAEAAAAYKPSRVKRSSGSDGIVQQLEGVFASKPAAKPTAKTSSTSAAAKKKKSNTVGCIIAAVIILFVALTIICSIAN